MLQQMPQPCDTSLTLHGLDRPDRTTVDLSLRHASMIALWEQRHWYIFASEPFVEPMPEDDPYMIWYISIT